MGIGIEEKLLADKEERRVMMGLLNSKNLGFVEILGKGNREVIYIDMGQLCRKNKKF